MKNLFITAALLIGSLPIVAQQIPMTSPLQELQHIWNPAFTAPSTNLEVTGFYRKQWVGFDNAPNTALVSLQYPFLDLNMSGGLLIMRDQTGPVSKMGLQLNYSYMLKEVFKDDDHLALGLNGYFYQYRFNPNGEVINEMDDPLLNGATQTKFNPSVGFGFAYFSNTEEWSRDDIFYIGASTLQLLPSELLLESGSAPRERHYFFNIGNKFFSYDYYLEPSVQVNYVNPEIINILLGMKYEMEETFWAGINYSSNNDFNFYGGVILEDVGGRYSSLRLGVLAGFNAGPVFNAGPGFEFYIGYRFDTD